MEYAFFDSETLEFHWKNSKSNYVAPIHMRHSLLPIFSPLIFFFYTSIQFLCLGGLFHVFTWFLVVEVFWWGGFLTTALLHSEEKEKGFHSFPSFRTKCLWGRLLWQQAKGFSERKVSVPRVKQLPWQPVIKAPATFL